MTGRTKKKIVYAEWYARYSLNNQNSPFNQKKDKHMHNAGLLIIYKPEIHHAFYFEISSINYFQLLMKKVMKIKDVLLQPLTTYKHHKVNVIHQQQSIGIVQDSPTVNYSETPSL